MGCKGGRVFESLRPDHIYRKAQVERLGLFSFSLFLASIRQRRWIARCPSATLASIHKAMRMRIAALLLTTAVLAGCSGIPSKHYVEPTQQESTARVRPLPTPRFSETASKAAALPPCAIRWPTGLSKVFWEASPAHSDARRELIPDDGRCVAVAVGVLRVEKGLPVIGDRRFELSACD